MATASTLDSPFNSTLDAILHYYPLGRPDHDPIIDFQTRTTADTISNLTNAPTLDTSLSPNSDHSQSQSGSISTLDLSESLPPLDLPLPYIYPGAHLNLSSSRFSPNRNQNHLQHQQIHQPEPRRAAATPKHILNPQRRIKMDTSPSRNLAAPRPTRGGSSPSRSPYHGLTALSPLQGISPMQSMSKPATTSAAVSESPKKPSSLQRVPSRRASMVQSAAEWQREPSNENRAAGFEQFSKLILYRAPKEDEPGFGKVRSKSSSALSPFTAAGHEFASSPTSDRGPRKSFGVPLFSGSTSRPLHVRTPSAGNTLTDTANRLFDRSAKPMSPADVWDMANSLKSPVAIPEGGFNGAELKRRKSGSGARRSSSSNSLAAMNESSEPKSPPLALEPVEYVQMQDEVLLPFVEREEEVAELLAHENNKKWMSDLQAAFPKEKARQHWQAMLPESWSWEEFMRHMRLKRAECPDYQYVFRARQACRKRSIAIWEKLGTCLGCDGDLLNAGGDDGQPSTWNIGAEDGDTDEDEDDDYKVGNQVWIEGLEAVDPDAVERAEKDFAGAFGAVVPDSPAMGLGMMGAIGEDEDEEEHPPSRSTPAQRAGNQASIDPFHQQSQLQSPKTGTRNIRSKSFVGLTIMTSPRLGVSGSSPNEAMLKTPPSPFQSTSNSLSSSVNQNHGQHQARVYQSDRGIEAPLFPTSFNRLSIEPNLGRAAEKGLTPGVPGGKGAVVSVPIAPGEGRKWGLNRKQSGAGLSESAITFESESDYGPVHDDGSRQ